MQRYRCETDTNGRRRRVARTRRWINSLIYSVLSGIGRGVSQSVTQSGRGDNRATDAGPRRAVRVPARAARVRRPGRLGLLRPARRQRDPRGAAHVAAPGAGDRRRAVAGRSAGADGPCGRRRRAGQCQDRRDPCRLEASWVRRGRFPRAGQLLCRSKGRRDYGSDPRNARCPGCGRVLRTERRPAGRVDKPWRSFASPPLAHTRRSRTLTASTTTIHDKGDATGSNRLPDSFVIPGNPSTEQSGQIGCGSHGRMKETTGGNAPPADTAS